MTTKTLLQTLSEKQFLAATGLLLGASACEWASWDGAALSCAGNADLVKDCYEARFFHATAELRWRADASAGVDAEGAKLGTFAQIDARAGKTRGTENHYLLWGKFDASGKKLTQLPRGVMQVPVTGKQGQIVVLMTEEIRRKDRNGNVYVADERWVALTAYSEKCAKKMLNARYGQKPKANAAAKESSHDA